MSAAPQSASDTFVTPDRIGEAVFEFCFHPGFTGPADAEELSARILADLLPAVEQALRAFGDAPPDVRIDALTIDLAQTGTTLDWRDLREDLRRQLVLAISAQGGTGAGVPKERAPQIAALNWRSPRGAGDWREPSDRGGLPQAETAAAQDAATGLPDDGRRMAGTGGVAHETPVPPAEPVASTASDRAARPVGSGPRQPTVSTILPTRQTGAGTMVPSAALPDLAEPSAVQAPPVFSEVSDLPRVGGHAKGENNPGVPDPSGLPQPAGAASLADLARAWHLPVGVVQRFPAAVPERLLRAAIDRAQTRSAAVADAHEGRATLAGFPAMPDAPARPDAPAAEDALQAAGHENPVRSAHTPQSAVLHIADAAASPVFDAWPAQVAPAPRHRAVPPSVTPQNAPARAAADRVDLAQSAGSPGPAAAAVHGASPAPTAHALSVATPAEDFAALPSPNARPASQTSTVADPGRAGPAGGSVGQTGAVQGPRAAPGAATADGAFTANTGGFAPAQTSNTATPRVPQNPPHPLDPSPQDAASVGPHTFGPSLQDPASRGPHPFGPSPQDAASHGSHPLGPSLPDPAPREPHPLGPSPQDVGSGKPEADGPASAAPASSGTAPPGAASSATPLSRTASRGAVAPEPASARPAPAERASSDTEHSARPEAARADAEATMRGADLAALWHDQPGVFQQAVAGRTLAELFATLGAVLGDTATAPLPPLFDAVRRSARRSSDPVTVLLAVLTCIAERRSVDLEAILQQIAARGPAAGVPADAALQPGPHAAAQPQGERDGPAMAAIFSTPLPHENRDGDLPVIAQTAARIADILDGAEHPAAAALAEVFARAVAQPGALCAALGDHARSVQRAAALQAHLSPAEFAQLLAALRPGLPEHGLAELRALWRGLPDGVVPPPLRDATLAQFAMMFADGRPQVGAQTGPLASAQVGAQDEPVWRAVLWLAPAGSAPATLALAIRSNIRAGLPQDRAAAAAVQALDRLLADPLRLAAPIPRTTDARPETDQTARRSGTVEHPGPAAALRAPLPASAPLRNVPAQPRGPHVPHPDAPHSTDAFATEPFGAAAMPTRAAGLVLLAPYLPQLFQRLDLVTGGQFRGPAAMERALDALHTVVRGSLAPEPAPRPLERLLCGVPAQVALRKAMPLDAAAGDLVEGLLRAILMQWKAVGKTSVAGLREAFLQRDGLLQQGDGSVRLRVMPKPYDMLLDRLPWGFRVVKFAWMPEPLHVSWRGGDG